MKVHGSSSRRTYALPSFLNGRDPQKLQRLVEACFTGLAGWAVDSDAENNTRSEFHKQFLQFRGCFNEDPRLTRLEGEPTGSLVPSMAGSGGRSGETSLSWNVSNE